MESEYSMCSMYCTFFFFFKQKTAYEMRISDWSSDVCSSDLGRPAAFNVAMRGIVPSDPTQISRDGTVAIYLDGVYLGRSQGLSGDLLDLERIEVQIGRASCRERVCQYV